MSLFSIVMPVLNESTGIAAQLHSLQDFRTAGNELIVVDGGSSDSTAQIAEPLADQVLTSEPGRARQMNCGAALAGGEWLIFLHADTQLPEQFWQSIVEATADGAQWGWFDVRLSNPSLAYRIIAGSMNRRARLTRVCTGDQCLFVRRHLFQETGGFEDIPLMEDIALSKRLRRVARPAPIAAVATTSSRRWEKRGIVRTIVHMWKLRLLYFIGVSPLTLARQYYPEHGH